MMLKKVCHNRFLYLSKVRDAKFKDGGDKRNGDDLHYYDVCAACVYSVWRVH